MRELRTVAPLTLAPSLENSSAVAFPMPVEAPVTRATLPSSLPGILGTILCYCSTSTSFKQVLVGCAELNLILFDVKIELFTGGSPERCGVSVSVVARS